MSNRGMGLLAVAAACVLLIGVLAVRSALGPPAPKGEGALFGAFVQPGPTTGL